MGYTIGQISNILLKADRTMYKIGQIAYDDMFSEDSESLDYERDIIFIYKKAVEYADDFFIGTEKLDKTVERLATKIAVYDYGILTAIYNDVASFNTNILQAGSVLNDLDDVTITNILDNQLLRYNAATGQWINVGPGAAVRNSQSFVATAGQTTFTTAYPFDAGLYDIYLNGVKLNSNSYTTLGEYTFILNDAAVVDDIIDITIYDPSTGMVNPVNTLAELDDVNLGPLVNNQVLYYNSTTGLWENKIMNSALWGNITGTLSNQTDLQNALNAKFDDPTGTTSQYIRGDGTLATFPSLTGYVPYTGATTNVNLGEFEMKAGQLTLDLTPTGTAAVATTRWNDTNGVSETTLKGGSVVLKNGIDLVARVVNKVTPNATLTKAAYQAVRVSGAQGQRLAVAYAQANNDANSADTIGLVCETIATNQEGFIMAVGQLENINTTGSLQGETWVDGDVLYLSPFTAGALTKVKPTGNGHIVVIGYVEYAHVNNGKIYVKVMNGWELDELHDVNIVTPLNNEALIYETATALWKNKSIATALGYTPEQPLTFTTPLSRATNTISIPQATGSVSGFLSSTDWTTFNSKQNALTNPITGTAAAGQVAYFTGATTQSGEAGLTWDTTNKRLKLASTGGAPLYIEDTDATSTFNITSISNNGGNFNLETRSSAGAFVSTDYQLVKDTASSTYHRWFTAANTERMRLFNTGNLVLNSTSDSGQRLQVTGTTLLNGDVTFSSSTGLFWDSTNSRLGIGTNTPTNPINILSSNAALGFRLEHATPSSASFPFQITNSADTNYIRANVNIIEFVRNGGASTIRTKGSSNDLLIQSFRNLQLAINDGTIAAQLFSTGNLALQNGGTFTDSGQRLQVTGTAYFSDSVGIGNSGSVASSLRISKALATGNTIGIYMDSQIQSTLSNVAYFQSEASTSASAITVTNLRHFFATQPSVGAGSTITNQYGFFVQGTMTGATNDYAFFSDLAAGTNIWNLYMNGTANNYMAGSLGIGQTTLTGSNLRISKAHTGSASAINFYIDSTIQSDVTNSPKVIATTLSTQAAAFTVARATHYLANQGTIGAGSTITTQVGFEVDNTLIGATINYGFFGNIASGTNRWNLYMNGTAANYLNGSLLIGSTTDSGEKLQVTGTMKVTGASSFGGNISLSLNQNNNSELSIINTTSGTSSQASLRLQSSSGSGAIGKYSATTTAFKTISATDFFVYNTTGDIAILNDNASGNIKFAAGGSSTTQMLLNASGNLGLGVTNQSERLQIAGNILLISGYNLYGNSTSGNYSRIELYNASTGNMTLGTYFATASMLFLTNGTERMRINAAGNLLIGSTTDSGEKLQVTGTAKITGASTINGLLTNSTTLYPTLAVISSNSIGAGMYLRATGTSGGYFTILSTASGAGQGAGKLVIVDELASATRFVLDASGNIGIGTASPNASAILQADSTTKGFLPPRGTNAQMIAIASPATGLVFYDTTNNKLNCYDGTTWQPCW